MNGRRIIPPSSLGLMHRQQPHRDNHEHSFPFEPFPEGEVQNPEACWDQHSESERINRYYKPERQWGDQQVKAITEGQTFTFGYFLDLKIHMPATVNVRLSAVDIAGAITGTVNSLYVDWTLDIGCGRALQIISLRQLVQPLSALPADQTDLSLSLPIHALRVAAKLTFEAGVLDLKPNVQMVAMSAPVMSYPGMIAR